jgi:CheY-like chemotaxis protein
MSSASSAPELSARSGDTVLVVEDDEAIREALADALELEGLPVEVAEDGAQALRMMLAAAPRLVLLDLMMPNMTGWQVLREIRTHPELQAVSVFVITAAGNVGTVPPGIPVFVKPLALDSLIIATKRMVAATAPRLAC